MTLPNLVSFSGYTASGKDAAADILVQRARFVKTHITKPLELALVRLNPWVVDQREETIERFEDLYRNLGDRATKDFPEARRLLQALEDEVGPENYWTDLVFDEVVNLLALDRKVALAGVRTSEELALVRKLDGVCVWIDRPVKVQAGAGVTADDCDVVVTNDGSVKDLYVKLVVALEEHNAKNKSDIELDRFS